MKTYLVYNLQTKEQFPFTEYKDAFNGYLAVIRDGIKNESDLIPEDWCIVSLNKDGSVERLERFEMAAIELDPACCSLEELEEYIIE